MAQGKVLMATRGVFPFSFAPFLTQVSFVWEKTSLHSKCPVVISWFGFLYFLSLYIYIFMNCTNFKWLKIENSCWGKNILLLNKVVDYRCDLYRVTWIQFSWEGFSWEY